MLRKGRTTKFERSPSFFECSSMPELVQMTKSESNKRLAERFAAFIRALGSVPLLFSHGNEKICAVALQKQYKELSHLVDPAIAAKARIPRERRYGNATLSPPPLGRFDPGPPSDVFSQGITENVGNFE